MPKLTKHAIDALQPGEIDYFVWDSEIIGFGIRVMRSGAKTYQAQYRKGGRTRCVSLGRHCNITPDQALLKAHEVMGLSLHLGLSPTAKHWLCHQALAFANIPASTKPKQIALALG